MKKMHILLTAILLTGLAVFSSAEDVEEATVITLKTTKGDIKIELNEEKAPKTVANFLGYVERGHYTGTIFHRVIPGFMVQGGGFTTNMVQTPTSETVENEANNGLKNLRGTIAMARTQAPHSAGAQFFINVKDNGFLDFRSPTMQGWGYAVFGKVVEGMDVVEEIEGVKTGRSGPHSDVPLEPIVINEVIVD
jgi:peptidyl-prolyl cis-trans isomerase B (cyclophilin B)